MSTTKNDKLAMRLSIMLQRFNDGARMRVDEMSEEFGVSNRTIQRDLQRFCFLPIEKERGEYFIASYALGDLSYKDIKKFSSTSGIIGLYPKLSEATIVDILNPESNRSLKVKGQNYEDLSSKVEMFNDLGASILSQYKVTFVYKNKNRKVKPYKLFNTNGIWYLVAVEKGTLKHYTFSKLKDFSVTQKHFSLDEKILELLDDNTHTWITQEPIDVTLHISTEVSEYFKRRSLLSSQEIVEEHESHIVLKASVAYEEELLRTVRYWVPHIRIVSPSYLQEKLEDSLQNYLK